MPSLTTSVLLALLAAVWFIVARPPEFPTHAPAPTNAIIITGAGSGIGRDAALALAALGFHVFAGVRKAADGDALLAASATPTNLTPLILDITDDEHIATAVQTVRSSGKNVVGLVNNAAISIAGPMEVVTHSRRRLAELMNVNYLSVVAVTNAFLPLVRTAHGRILFVSSLAGRISGMLNGAYCSTKHALEAAADAYRQELFPDIAVSIIEPGMIETNMLRNLSRSLADWRAPYADVPVETLDRYETWMGHFNNAVSHSPLPIGTTAWTTDVIVHALTATRPATRYLVGYDANILARLREFLPDSLFDTIGRDGMSRQ